MDITDKQKRDIVELVLSELHKDGLNEATFAVIGVDLHELDSEDEDDIVYEIGCRLATLDKARAYKKERDLLISALKAVEHPTTAMFASKAFREAWSRYVEPDMED